ncbi:transcriptional regulator [Streptacidiphilus cavernicola]|uniref:Transcriptional regulator n=1 Tax=Streptacidiphilus cavernicola TaxID=3342716 RepID=A0ABV6VYK4_9ACTN
MRLQQGLGKAKLAQKLNEHAIPMGVNLATNRTTVWRWETGQYDPDEKTQAVIASFFGLANDQWRHQDWPLWLPVWEVQGLSASWDAPGTVETLTHLNRSGLLDRRGFVTVTGAALMALIASWADAPSAFASVLAGDRVTDTMVAKLEKRVESLRELDAEMGGARLLEQARGDLALVSGILQQGRYTEEHGRRLHALAARVCYLTGWMAYDSGLHSAGQQYYVGALRASRSAGDDEFGAFAMAEMGVQLGESGHTSERLAMINAAIATTPSNIHPAVQSYLHLHQAGSLSRTGQDREAATALHRATKLWDKADGDRPEWMGWYGSEQIASTHGKILIRTGRVQEATAALESSISSAVPRDRAVRSARLAEARLMGHDLEGALAAANIGAQLLEESVNSARATSRLTEFSAALEPYAKVTQVAEFRDRLRALPTVAA